jgi:photosystem II stability/assembly factor-like uncharacterized protein
MAFEWKLGELVMLISTHAMHATLTAPFLPAGWIAVEDSSFGNTNINSIAYDGISRIVAVGSSGKIAISDNTADNWTQVSSPFSGSNVYSVAYGDGLFVAGGSIGKLATSPDGETWTLQDSGFGASTILGITYASVGSTWVIVGSSGKLATSIDALSWTLRASSFGSTFINEVFAAPDIVIAVGYDGKLASSPNGTVWTQRASSFVNSTINGVTVSADNAQYVAVGDSGKVAYSANGTSWTQIFPQSSFGASSIKAIVSTDETYLAAGSAGKLANALSPIPESWKQRDSTFGLDSINYLLQINNEIAIAVGDEGKIAYSL